MIRPDEELHSATSFGEWVSLFSGNYFVMIVVYADESGTHDASGKKQGSAYPIIAGFAARKSVWDKFLTGWGKVLNTYDAPYFHGRELKGAELAIEEKRPLTKELLKNPYLTRGWDLKKIKSFREDLTKVAVAGRKIPIAGAVSIPKFNKNKTDDWDQDPYKMCMDHFFAVYHHETKLQWGNFKSDVNFIFDQNEKKEWLNAVHEVFDKWQKLDTRMGGPSFQDKKKYPYWPLQAADLFAYRIRQLTEDYENGKLELTKLDNILLNNLLKSGQIVYPKYAHLLK